MPLINAGGTAGTITGATAAQLDLTALDFGGIYNGINLLLAPEDECDAYGAIVASCTIDGPLYASDGIFTGNSTTGLDYYVDYLTAGSAPGDYDFVIRWSSVISQGITFDGKEIRLRLEGTIHTEAIPVPAAFWLFGSGVLGLVDAARRKKPA